MRTSKSPPRRPTGRPYLALGSTLAVAATLWSAAARAGDPTTVDCLNASGKSIPLRTESKLRNARAQLLVCASANCPADIRKECSGRVEEVNKAIPTIVFGAKDPKGNDVTAVKVTMDGESIAEKLEGTAISLDPGAHTFTFQAAGQPLLTKQIVVRAGEKDRREIVQLGSADSGPAPAPAAPPGDKPESSKTPLGGQRIAAIAVAGAGVVGIGVGAVFGVMAISKHGDAQDACPNTTCPTQAGLDLWDQSRTDGTISTIAFIAGGALVAGGAVLWFTAKPKRAEVGVGPGTLTVKGVW